MRSGRVTINYVLNMHYDDPIVNDDSISFDHSDLWINLELNGVLSYFHTRLPTKREMHECKKFLLTPD